MFLSSINLKNIRKHTDTHIEFTGKLNYIVGGNGVGKTTVLEAIYYLCTTKSCITSSDSEVVRFGEKGFSVRGKFLGSTNDDVQVIYSFDDNRKSYFLSNKQIHKFSDVIGRFPVVMLSPADHSITQGYSADRRKFIDSILSQASRTYLNLLQEYNKTLKHRTALFNRIRENSRVEKSETSAWNENLVRVGKEIIIHRKDFIKEFLPYIRNTYYEILGKREEPGINYHFLGGNCTEDIESCFHMLLEQRMDDEIRRATNLVGPHRDEYVFDINGLNLKTYGSQGQHKTFQTILRFAEYFYLNDKTGSEPLFLLDDVFGELDAERAVAISNYLGTLGQAFVTLTDFGNLSFLSKRETDKLIKLSMDSEVIYA